MEVTGLINPMAPDQTNELRIVVRNVDLTPTSPYVGKFAGYQLAQGKLQMDLAYNLTGRKLKSRNVIILDRFAFGDQIHSPEATRLPVRLAVAILKDREGRIKLDVPIEGSLDDPQFRLHKVIVGALVNLLTKVATSPFSLLGSLFGGKGEEIRYQDFDSGSAEILAVSKDKLDSLAKGLYERPGLQLEIQGCADPSRDREGLQELAFERRLRTAKWQALDAARRDQIKPDQIPLSPEERTKLVRKLYAEALVRGEVPSLDAQTNTPPVSPTPAAKQPGAGAPQPVARAHRLHPPVEEHGGAALMKRPAPPVSARSVVQSPPAQSGGPGAPAATDSATDDQQLEQRLVKSLVVRESDLKSLAARRAEAVRDYLIQSGKVEPTRLFFAENPASDGASRASRVYLQLR